MFYGFGARNGFSQLELAVPRLPPLTLPPAGRARWPGVQRAAVRRC